ncbi:MAG TPA: 50S ribosomal protein L9 [Candidatus Omnitrophica bacterium]|nr:50S ribosomal protein L9 [Candidatus Omnitrophota bacterium]
MAKEKKTKVILLKNIEKLGKEMEVVEVKPGYARNYLIPHGLALKANRESFELLEKIKKERLKIEEKEKKEALKLKEKLEKISLTITVQAKDDEEIYGSIQEVQILKALEEEGVNLEKGKLVLEEPIKKIGVYNLKVNLHPQIQANLRVWVVKK